VEKGRQWEPSRGGGIAEIACYTENRMGACEQWSRLLDKTGSDPKRNEVELIASGEEDDQGGGGKSEEEKNRSVCKMGAIGNQVAIKGKGEGKNE